MKGAFTNGKRLKSQARITLFNMLDYTYQNDVIMKNPYNGMQEILGHSNIGIKMNLYVHTAEDEKHKEIEKIAASFKVV